jgi:hypothetical protein
MANLIVSNTAECVSFRTYLSLDEVAMAYLARTLVLITTTMVVDQTGRTNKRTPSGLLFFFPTTLAGIEDALGHLADKAALAGQPVPIAIAPQARHLLDTLKATRENYPQHFKPAASESAETRSRRFYGWLATVLTIWSRPLARLYLAGVRDVPTMGHGWFDLITAETATWSRVHPEDVVMLYKRIQETSKRFHLPPKACLSDSESDDSDSDGSRQRRRKRKHSPRSPKHGGRGGPAQGQQQSTQQSAQGQATHTHKRREGQRGPHTPSHQAQGASAGHAQRLN